MYLCSVLPVVGSGHSVAADSPGPCLSERYLCLRNHAVVHRTDCKVTDGGHTTEGVDAFAKVSGPLRSFFVSAPLLLSSFV